MLLPSEEFDRLQRKGKLPKPEKMSRKGAMILLARNDQIKLTMIFKMI